MGVFEVKGIYQYGDRFWENVWHIDVGSAEDVPAGVTDALKNFSVHCLLDAYTFVKLVRRPVGSHDAFVEAIYNLPGNRHVGSSEPMPLFNTVRLLLSAFSGRPGLKFLRGLLLISDIVATGGALGTPVMELVESEAGTLITAIVDAACELVVLPDKVISAPTVQPMTQMRQLHRKRKKPTV